MKQPAEYYGRIKILFFELEKNRGHSAMCRCGENIYYLLQCGGAVKDDICLLCEDERRTLPLVRKRIGRKLKCNLTEYDRTSIQFNYIFLSLQETKMMLETSGVFRYRSR